MMTKEQFENIELRHGCGYWFVCDDHACPCSPDSPVGRGYSEEVYSSMKSQQERDRELLDR